MRNDYSIIFQRQADGLIVRLPINPETLPVSRDSENSDYNVFGLGPIVVPRLPGLRKVTIESYFPGRADLLTLTSGEFEAAKFYLDFFDRAMLQKEILIYTPVRYYENGEQFMAEDSGFPVIVSSFSYEERGAETGDFYYTLELTEYKDYSPLTVTIKTDSGGGGGATATAETPREVPQEQLVVDSKVTVNGAYYYSSYGDEPHGNANGGTFVVSRIITNDDTRAYPVHLTTESGGARGWVKREDCQVVSE